MNATRIKISGITTVSEAQLAGRAGADAIGMTLHASGGAREIETTLAVKIARAVPPLVARVGIFENATAPYIARCARSIPLDLIQLDGHETFDFVRALASFRIIKTIRLEELAPWVQSELPNLAGLRLEVRDVTQFDLISARLRELEPVTPIFLAGNWQTENVGPAVQKIRPFAIDFSIAGDGERNESIGTLVTAITRMSAL